MALKNCTILYSKCQGLSQDSNKKTVQNSNSKISGCPDLATNLLQILILTAFNSLVSKKPVYTSYVLSDGLLGKYLVITPRRSKLKILYLKYFACPRRKFSEKLPVQKTGRTGPG